MLILSNSVESPSDFALALVSKSGRSRMTARTRSNSWREYGSTGMTSDEVNKFDSPALSADQLKGVINQVTPAMIRYLKGMSDQVSAVSVHAGDANAFANITERNEVLNHSFVMGAATLRWLMNNRRSQHLYSDYGLAALMIRETGTYRFGPYSGTRSTPPNAALRGLPSVPKDGAVGITSTRYGVDIVLPRYTIVNGQKVLNHSFTTGFGGRQPVWWQSNNQQNLFKSLLGFVKSTSLIEGFFRVTMKDLEKLYFSLSATPWWFQALMIACEARERITNVDRMATSNGKKMVANPTFGQLWYGYYQLENSNVRKKLISSEYGKKELNAIDNIFAYVGAPQTFTQIMTEGPSSASVLHRSILFDLPWLDDLQWARCVAGLSNSDLRAIHIEETTRSKHTSLGSEPSVSALISAPTAVGLGDILSPSVRTLRDTIDLEQTVTDQVADPRKAVPLSRRIILY